MRGSPRSTSNEGGKRFPFTAESFINYKVMRNLLLMLCLIWVGSGCATPNRAHLTDRGGDVYPEEELASFVFNSSPGAAPTQYIIGVGDRLDVTFFFHKELTTNNLLVRPDGRITLPYVGDVVAAGYAPMHLDTLLTEQFSEILKDPNLSVILRHSEDPMVFVVGQVRQPGSFRYKQQLSLTQAVALAGGLQRGAHTKQVLVLRREGVDRILGVQIDLQAILDGRTIQNDIPLRNMDLVVVPKTALESAAQTMDAVQEIMLPIRDVLFLSWQVFILQDQFRSD